MRAYGSPRVCGVTCTLCAHRRLHAPLPLRRQALGRRPCDRSDTGHRPQPVLSPRRPASLALPEPQVVCALPPLRSGATHRGNSAGRVGSGRKNFVRTFTCCTAHALIALTNLPGVYYSPGVWSDYIAHSSGHYGCHAPQEGSLPRGRQVHYAPPHLYGGFLGDLGLYLRVAQARSAPMTPLGCLTTGTVVSPAGVHTPRPHPGGVATSAGCCDSGMCGVFSLPPPSSLTGSPMRPPPSRLGATYRKSLPSPPDYSSSH